MIAAVDCIFSILKMIGLFITRLSDLELSPCNTESEKPITVRQNTYANECLIVAVHKVT